MTEILDYSKIKVGDYITIRNKTEGFSFDGIVLWLSRSTGFLRLYAYITDKPGEFNTDINARWRRFDITDKKEGFFFTENNRRYSLYKPTYPLHYIRSKTQVSTSKVSVVSKEEMVSLFRVTDDHYMNTSDTKEDFLTIIIYGNYVTVIAIRSPDNPDKSTAGIVRCSNYDKNSVSRAHYIALLHRIERRLGQL